MDQNPYKKLNINQNVAEILNSEKEQREKICKQIGDYLISHTEACMDCVDISHKRISKKENKCIENCFSQMIKTNQIVFNKYLKLNKNDKVSLKEKAFNTLNFNELIN